MLRDITADVRSERIQVGEGFENVDRSGSDVAKFPGSARAAVASGCGAHFASGRLFRECRRFFTVAASQWQAVGGSCANGGGAGSGDRLRKEPLPQQRSRTGPARRRSRIRTGVGSFRTRVSGRRAPCRTHGSAARRPETPTSRPAHAPQPLHAEHVVDVGGGVGSRRWRGLTRR